MSEHIPEIDGPNGSDIEFVVVDKGRGPERGKM